MAWYVLNIYRWTQNFPLRMWVGLIPRGVETFETQRKKKKHPAGNLASIADQLRRVYSVIYVVCFDGGTI